MRRISRRRPVLSIDDLHRLLDEVDHPTFRLMIILAVCLGLRASEVAALKWGDFDFDGQLMTVRRTILAGQVSCACSRRAYVLTLDCQLVEMLLDWRSETSFSHKTDWVFASPSTAGKLPHDAAAVQHFHIRKAALKAGLSGATGWRIFRRTYASTLFSMGNNLRTIQQLLRHSSPTTRAAFSVAPRTEDLREANQKFIRLILETGDCDAKRAVTEGAPTSLIAGSVNGKRASRKKRVQTRPRQKKRRPATNA